MSATKQPPDVTTYTTAQPVLVREKRHIFCPRIYWNGSSTGNPKLEDFAAEGFEPVRTYRRSGGAE